MVSFADICVSQVTSFSNSSILFGSYEDGCLKTNNGEFFFGYSEHPIVCFLNNHFLNYQTHGIAICTNRLVQNSTQVVELEKFVT